MPLVTNTRLVQWKRRGREGEGADREPVERRQPGVGHSGREIYGKWLSIRIGNVLATDGAGMDKLAKKNC